MDIVFKGIDDQVTTFEHLDDSVSEKIGAWYRGDETLSNEISSVLDRVHKMNALLSCNCIEPSPLMHIRKNQNTTSLVINKTSIDHSEDCVFHHSYRRATKYDILKTVNHSVQLNCVASNWKVNKNNLLNQYNKLRSDISALEIAPGVNLNLYFDTMPDSINRLAGRMRKYKKIWPEQGEFASVIAVVSDSVVKDKINYTHKNKTGSILIPKNNMLDASIEGPYLSLIKIAENSKGYIEPMNAFSIPIMNRYTLVRVKKSGHRLLLKKLMQLQQWWYEKHHLNIKIKAVYKNGVDFELFKNGEIMARSSCIENIKEKQTLLNNGMDVIYFDTSDPSEEKQKHFARILTAHLLSKENYHEMA